MLSAEFAGRLAGLALAGVEREYPNKLDHVLRSGEDVRGPRELHPSFFGCYDWHSAVHGHWVLVLLGMRSEGRGVRDSVVAVLDRNLSTENLAVEASYLEANPGFERPYGWGWVLQLAAELRRLNPHPNPLPSKGEGTWLRNIEPLERVARGRVLEYFSRLDYPVRVGTHGNSAFALGLAFDYAVEAGDLELEEFVRERAMTYFGGNAGYPAWLEPGGEDFLSPCLVEADLMRRVFLEEGEFQAWFSRFLPEVGSLLVVPRVSDRGDARIGHLDGLCLSKAWCLRRIGRALLSSDAGLAGRLELAAEEHAEAGLAHVFTGEYLGEHWLGTFAAYLLLGF